MAVKHPKHRRIPRTLLKIKALKSMENKVIMGVHVLELIVILFTAAVTVTTAFFLGFNKSFHNFNFNAINHMSDKAIEQLNLDTKDDTKTVESVDSKSIESVDSKSAIDNFPTEKEVISITKNTR